MMYDHHPLHYGMHHPMPHFCIFRPGGSLVPLIPVDELPAWLQICSWSPSMYMQIQPVTLSVIPRLGEYDVICHHCSSGVDSLHQSVSDRDDSPRSSNSRRKSCPEILSVTGIGTVPPSVDPKMAFPAGFRCPVTEQQPLNATPGSPPLEGLPFNMPHIPGMTFNFEPMLTPFVSQLPPNMINPSPPGSDVGVKGSSSDPIVPPQKPNLNGQDPGDSASLLKLASLPPPVVPLEEDRSTTPAPCAPSKHPLSPDTQGRISQAIAASLCSVSVENENIPPRCPRRPSIGQASNSNIVASIANEDGVHSVPLITAIDHLKEVINFKEIPPPTSPRYSSVSGGSGKHTRSRSLSRVSITSSKPLSRASSKAKRRRDAAQRRRERANRRRERRKEKLEGVDAVSPKGKRHRRDKIPWDNGEGESQNLLEQKPEQVNSYTKRRDRREKQAKSRKDHASKSRHMHMSMSSK